MGNFAQLVQDIAGIVGTTQSATGNAATTASWVMDGSTELDLQATAIIADAEWDLANDLTVQQLKTTITGTLSIGTNTIARPGNLISPEHLTLTVANSAITGLALVNPGNGYNSPPAWTFSNNASAICSVNALGQVIGSTFLLTSAGNTVLTAPTATASAPGVGNTATATTSISASRLVELRLRTREYIEAAYPIPSNTGRPASYGVADGSNYILGPTPDQAYAYSFEYIGKPTALSANNPTNVFTTTFYRLLRARCLAYAASFQLDFDGKPAQVQNWEAQYARLLKQVLGTDARASRDLVQEPFWVADNRIGQPPPTGTGQPS